MILFVFSANILGEIGSFYEKIPFLDTILHTLNGFICAGVGFGLTDILNRSKKVKFNLSPIFVCLFSFCFSMTAGTVWEFFEFGVDTFLGKDMQKDTIVTTINSTLLSGNDTNAVTHISGITSTTVSGKDLGINGYLDIGLIDTMKDLLVNFIGAIVFNGLGFIYLKNRGIPWISRPTVRNDIAQGGGHAVQGAQSQIPFAEEAAEGGNAHQGQSQGGEAAHGHGDPAAQTRKAVDGFQE